VVIKDKKTSWKVVVVDAESLELGSYPRWQISDLYQNRMIKALSSSPGFSRFQKDLMGAF
jgi:hypothetical protein